VQCELFDLASPAHIEPVFLPEWTHPHNVTGFEDGQPPLQPAKEKSSLGVLLTHTSCLANNPYTVPPLPE
jgi:hypothetical protein